VRVFDAGLTRGRGAVQRYDMPLRVERELALERLSQICAQKFFSVRLRALRSACLRRHARGAHAAALRSPPPPPHTHAATLSRPAAARCAASARPARAGSGAAR
jgi:hypothetical protein